MIIKKTFILMILLYALSSPAIAEQAYSLPVQMPAVIQEDVVMIEIASLQKEWAHINYQVVGKDAKINAIHTLEKKASQLTAQHPNRAEPLIWEGIILSTDAGIGGGLSALKKVKRAKALFEHAIQIDPLSLNGSAYTSLGSLYYQVPSWPIAFGSNEKAEKMLKRALEINPDGIDPNYFYGDFLQEEKRYREADKYLKHAFLAPPRENRTIADTGRKQEIKSTRAKFKISGQ